MRIDEKESQDLLAMSAMDKGGEELVLTELLSVWNNIVV